MAIDTFGKVLRLEESNEKKMASELHRTRQDQQELAQKKELLEQFREEYEQRLEAAGKVGMESRELQDFRLFLDRLNSAIEQQDQQVKLSDDRVNEAESHWLESWQRKASLNELIARQQLELAFKRSRLEQKETDELSAQQVAQHGSLHPNR